MDAIYHAEGRCTPNGATAFHYEYTLKDHLGNARVNFRANGTAVFFIEDMHYYPFGMQMEGMGTQNPANKYLYNGKERNEDLGLNLSDYGARWYDAALGRWWSVDPLAEKFINITPYNYAINNPVLMIDLFGMESRFYDDGSMHLEGEDAQNYFRGLQQEAERRKNRNKDSNLESDYTMYLFDATKKLSKKSQKNIEKYARQIYVNNEVHNVKFKFVDEKTAKSKEEWGGKDMFAAIVSSAARPGNTLIDTETGNTTGYACLESTSHCPERFASYVNAGWDEVSKRTGISKEYAIAYLAAHEALHQLLMRSAIKNNTSRPPDHVRLDGGLDHLNEEGNWVTIPKYSSTKIRQAETIINEQRVALKKLFGQ